MNLSFFENKVVCITGSSKGIGKATAILLGQQGAKICLNGRDETALQKTLKELKAIGIACISIAADVSKEEDCTTLIKANVDHFGKLDILINNAGISSRGLVEDISTEAWRHIIDVNLLGSIFPTIHALPHIINSKGSIVFISSLGGKVGMPGQSNYSVTKMGLTAFAQSLHTEHKADNIHIGIIYLGFVENEKDKKVLSAIGNYVPIKQLNNKKPTSREDAALSIAKAIIKRKKKVTLTVLGKLQAILLRLSPAAVNWYLRKELEKFKEHYN
ncbi:MAG: SDR family oxidoreductase [Bacteroidetes bacterium]|nr:SDR family oxidoreductase [Bacteroidota bacterium]